MGEMLVFDENSAVMIDNEHYHRQLVPGDPASVRTNMIAAVEQLDYHVIDETETSIKARRDARGWGASYSSADILDYAGSLSIRFKEHGRNATMLTFDYTMKHPSVAKGDKAILTREAEALAALASVSGRERICNSCGTRTTDDSRFCRQCGSPIIVEFPEMELMHMSSNVRAAQQSAYVAMGTAAGALALVGLSIWLLLNSGIDLTKGMRVLMVFTPVLVLCTLIFTLLNLGRLNKASTRKVKDREAYVPIRPNPEIAMPATLFSAQNEIGSIVENTTNLLPSEPDPAKTGEFATDREIGR